jgi:hypothetical protein
LPEPRLASQPSYNLNVPTSRKTSGFILLGVAFACLGLSGVFWTVKGLVDTGEARYADPANVVFNSALILLLAFGAVVCVRRGLSPSSRRAENSPAPPQEPPLRET